MLLELDLVAKPLTAKHPRRVDLANIRLIKATGSRCLLLIYLFKAFS